MNILAMGDPTFLDDPTTHTFFPSVSNPHIYGQTIRMRKGRQGWREGRGGREGEERRGEIREEGRKWGRREEEMEQQREGGRGVKRGSREGELFPVQG